MYIVTLPAPTEVAVSLTFKIPSLKFGSLDAYFPEGEVVNLIKIDIEGAEARAIYGMKRLLRESRPLVLVEFHDMIGWEGRKELFAADYRLHDIRRARWLKRERDIERVYQALAVPNELVESTGL